ncbi:aspartate aminotransferase, partial [Pseudomonas fluorescens]
FPDWVMGIINEHAHEFGRYPTNEGTPELLSAISGFLKRRYGVDMPEAQIMALNGTREGLHNALLALCPEETSRGQQPIVLTPNPFYQVYAVAARSVGAEPMFVHATAATGHLPDYTSLSPEVLNRVEVAYICSPANP